MIRRGIFGAVVLASLVGGFQTADGQSWQQIAPILQQRARPGCAELPDGRILIYGGELTSKVLNECEIYDPASDSWSTTGSLITPRFWAGVATLPDGRIFVAGGCTDVAGTATNSCEIYDPSSRVWSATASMARTRRSFNIIRLPDSNLLIVGGIDSSTSDFSSLAEEFDVHSETFTFIPQPQPSFYGYQADFSSELNGIFLAGGEFQSAFQPNGLSPVQLFDLTSWSWKQLPSLIEPVMGFEQLIKTSDGKIALLSGRSSFLNTTKDVQIFDPSTSSWTIAGSLPFGHDYGSSYLIRGDSILTVGGLYRYATPGDEVPTSWIDLRSGQTWPGPVPIVPRTSQATLMTISLDSPCSNTKIIYLFAGADTANNLTAVSEHLVFSNIGISTPVIQLVPTFSVSSGHCALSDTTIPLGIAGCTTANGELDSAWITGSSVFEISNTITLPRTLAVSDGIGLQYSPSSENLDTALLHIRYDFGSGAQDTTILIIGMATSQLSAQSGQIHREAASAYYGQIDSLGLGVDLSPLFNIDSLWPYITDIQLIYTWDSSVISYASYLPPADWLISSINHGGNSAAIDIQNNASTATQPLNLGMALFRPRSTQLATTWVELPSLVIDAGSQALSLCVTDNEDNHWAVKTLGVLSGVAGTQPLMQLALSIYPNPAEDAIQIYLNDPNSSPISYQVVDVLGTVRAAGEVSGTSLTLDVQTLANGLYYVRARNVVTGFVASGKFVIQR